MRSLVVSFLFCLSLSASVSFAEVEYAWEIEDEQLTKMDPQELSQALTALDQEIENLEDTIAAREGMAFAKDLRTEPSELGEFGAYAPNPSTVARWTLPLLLGPVGMVASTLWGTYGMVASGTPVLKDFLDAAELLAMENFRKKLQARINPIEVKNETPQDSKDIVV